MNDNIIISTISKIHFTIVSLLLFIFLTLSIIFVLLQNGIYISSISIPNIKIDTLYIKWNEKLDITIKEINIVKKSSNDTKIDYKELNNYFKKIFLFDDYFKEININKITFNDINASFKYAYAEKSYFQASSPNFSLKSTLFLESKLLNIEIDEFKHLNKNINLNGNIILNNLDLEATVSLNIDINNEIHFNLLAHTNQNKLLYKIDSHKNIKSIEYLVNILGLNKSLKYWIIDAINMKNLSLNKFYGWIDYDQLDQAYKNIYAHATLNKLHYTYDKQLDAIHTKTTDLEFKNGVLYIYPKKAYTYGFYLDKSWIKIDFTKIEELLTLNLKFNAMVNKDILYLLNRYNIKLPFKQNSGEVATNLKILVNLITIDVSAQGDFYTKKANFTYLGLDLDIFDTKILLNNYDVKINNMLAKYKNIVTANVDVALDTKNNKGYINFDVKKINFKEKGLLLNKPINLIYNISSKQDTIHIDKSSWDFKDKTLNLDSLNIPFYLDKLALYIPSTLIKIPNIGSAYLSGTTSFKEKTVNLNINLTNFSYQDVYLEDKNAILKLSYQDSNINIKSSKMIKLKLSTKNTTLDQISLDIKNNVLSLQNATINIENLLSTSLNGHYNMIKNSGVINLDNTEIKNQSLGSIFSQKEKVEFNIRNINNTIYIRAEEFDINFISSKKYWKLNINKLSNFTKKSNLLKKYFINYGNINIIKYIDNNKINFTAKITYPYNLILIDDKLVDNYTFDGYYNIKTNDSSFNINKKINIDINNRIDIKANDIGINIKEIINLLGKLEKTKKSDSNKITLTANDSYLYISKNRNVISDKINLQYSDNITTANLKYKKGSAGFILDKNIFHLYGENFNDSFIENLFSDSRFNGGKLDFSVNGDLNSYNGVFHIQDTVVIKYKILNNVLAFVNTIPSLVTFSLPGYNKEGLAVNNAYINFNTKDGNEFNIEDVSLDSKEVKIVGRGIANFEKNIIDMKLNLKTDLGSAISKIPVVGYIFLGNDTISSSLKISGKLNNPKVKTRLANDIVVAPLNIIKRTLLLPAYLIKKK
ncbi:MAG: AsmA-like C-terminal domain-containing protein [Campylobacterota bacterium]|nr:AsmA-like C-terminal domain-containing protein [Campylobacterota bacterium]